MDSKKIKIFVSYHKKCKMLKSDILTPIQVGSKLSNVDLGIQRDDDNDNISEKNKRFCETTAQYWAWKNCEADYYGFMQYRRHFAFKEIPYNPDDGGLICLENMDDEYIKMMGLDDESIANFIDDEDILITPLVDTSSWGSMTNEVQFSSLANLHAKDFDLMCTVVKEKYPDFSDAVDAFRIGHEAYWYNMFIMKAEIFHGYCSWLFDVMNEIDSRIDYANYDIQEARTVAFMAERLLSIYIIYLKQQNPDIKLRHMKMVFVQRTDDIFSEDTLASPAGDYVFETYVDAIERAYKEMHSIVLPDNVAKLMEIEPSEFENLIKGKKIIFYGAGNWCRQLLAYFKKIECQMPILIWDKAAKEGDFIEGIKVLPPSFEDYSGKDDVLCIVTLRNPIISKQICEQLREKDIEMINNWDFMDILSRKLWSEVE